MNANDVRAIVLEILEEELPKKIEAALAKAKKPAPKG